MWCVRAATLVRHMHAADTLSRVRLSHMATGPYRGLVRRGAVARVPWRGDTVGTARSSVSNLSVDGRSVEGQQSNSVLEGDTDDYIDFTNAGLYLAAVQVVGTTVVVAFVSVLCTWVVADWSSAPRVLAICVGVAVALLWTPLSVGSPVPGLCLVFAALRPCTFLYIVALVCGQLVHACLAVQAEDHTPLWRDILFHAAHLPLAACGMWRALHPTSEQDRTVVVAFATLLLLAMSPLPGSKGDGPLCAQPSIGTAAIRVARSLLFATVYSFHCFASAPSSMHPAAVMLSVARATAASVWVLGVPPLGLPLTMLQLAVLSWVRVAVSKEGAIEADRLCEELNGRATSCATAPRAGWVDDSVSEADPEMGGGGVRGLFTSRQSIGYAQVSSAGSDSDDAGVDAPVCVPGRWAQGHTSKSTGYSLSPPMGSIVESGSFFSNMRMPALGQGAGAFNGRDPVYEESDVGPDTVACVPLSCALGKAGACHAPHPGASAGFRTVALLQTPASARE